MSEKIYCYDSETGEYISSYDSFADIKHCFSLNIATNVHRSLRTGWKTNGYYWSKEKKDNYFDKKSTIQNNTKKSKEIISTDTYRDKLINQISNRYSIEELKIIAKGSPIKPQIEKPLINFSGDHIKIGVMGDTHLGSKYTFERDIYSAFEHFKKEGVDLVCHTGDVTEGLSHRPGHMYELDYLGYDQQKEFAIKVLEQCPAPIYMIDGNHDRWYIKSNGAIIVKDICDALPNATYLGHDEGDIMLKNNISLRLWHGEDGSSYATSYRIQKVVESLTGGDKPNILLLGHVHKFAYIFERHIHCVSTGCMQTQTPWMRGKRLSAHTGFSIIDLWLSNKGVSRFRQEFIPLYH